MGTVEVRNRWYDGERRRHEYELRPGGASRSRGDVHRVWGSGTGGVRVLPALRPVPRRHLPGLRGRVPA